MESVYHPLLKNAIELHVHSSPSIFPRRQTDWELIEDVQRAGMKGVVLKAHEGQTYDRATLLREKYPDLKIYGGLVCNTFSGGLSPGVVDIAIQMGAQIIWMPTISAEQHQKYYRSHSTGRLFDNDKILNQNLQGLKILNHDNKIKSEVYEILHLISENDVILATGHLSPEEVELLVPAAKSVGVRKILIQHADLGIAKIPLEIQKNLVSQGCLIEKCYLACSSDFNSITKEEMAASIKTLGPASCVMVTDYGQKHNIPPIQALGQFIQSMLDHGIFVKEIEQMVSNNPKVLLKLG